MTEKWLLSVGFKYWEPTLALQRRNDEMFIGDPNKAHLSLHQTDPNVNSRLVWFDYEGGVAYLPWTETQHRLLTLLFLLKLITADQFHNFTLGEITNV